jgi:hypothetical protein
MAGWSRGTSGKRYLMIGATARESRAIRPAFSATFINPSHRLITPMSPMEISTAVRADSTAPVVTPSAVPRKAATVTAMTIRANQM